MTVMLDKSKIKLRILLLIGFVVLGCKQDAKFEENLPMTSADISDEYQALETDDDIALKSNVTKSQIPKNLKIIKSASARYKVDNVKTATQKIKKIAQKYRAYISDLRFENNLYKKENRFTIKIPQEHFDAMMDSIGYIVDFVEYENITTKDVTEEYIDLQTRLKTKIEVKALYESIMRNKAKTVEDILKTEEKLRVIQEEIESVQGRLKYLSNKVSYSTMQIDLYETVAYTEEPESYSKTFFSKSKEGLSYGWTIIENIIIGLFYLWPLLVIGGVLFVIIRKKLKRKHMGM